VYKQCNAETIWILPFLTGKPTVYTSNLDVARQVVTGGVKSHWIKPEDGSRGMLLFGMNLAAAEKDTWRRHRRIMGPAFNNKAYGLVWDRTIRTYNDMITAEGWSNPSQAAFDEPIVQRLTFKFALHIIGSCILGLNSLSWIEPPKDASAEMSFQESLNIVSGTILIATIVPKWCWRLLIGWNRDIRRAHETLDTFIHAQVADHKMEVRSGASPRNDVLSMLVRANKEDGGKLSLNDTELIGNVFMLLFAGHETTAHTLAATIGLLGLYQEIQDEVLQQILEVVGPTREPTFADYDALYKVLGAFQEAMRMFPAGSLMIRIPTEDTVLLIPKPVGEEGSKTLPISKGQRVVVDMIGIQNNPRYFSEPDEYKPSRWYGAKNSSEVEFSAFSIGPRQCIGRKFATTEAVAFMTMLLRDWKVEPLLSGSETKNQWKDRVMQGKMMITFGVRNVPIRFTRRTAKIHMGGRMQDTSI